MMFIALFFFASMQIVSGDISVDSSEYSAQQRFTDRMKAATVITHSHVMEANKAEISESNLRGGAVAEFNWVEKEVGGKTTQGTHEGYAELTYYTDPAACHAGQGKRFSSYFKRDTCINYYGMSFGFHGQWMYWWGNTEDCNGVPGAEISIFRDETATCDLAGFRTISKGGTDIIKGNKHYGEVTLQMLQFRTPWAAENFDLEEVNFSVGILYIEEMNKCTNTWGEGYQSEILRCVDEDTVEIEAFSKKDCFGKKIGTYRWKLRPILDSAPLLPRCVKFDDSWVDYM